MAKQTNPTPAPERAPTPDVTFSFVSREGGPERLVCEAVVIKPGRAITFTEAQVWAESDGKRSLVMKASATMAVTAKV